MLPSVSRQISVSLAIAEKSLCFFGLEVMGGIRFPTAIKGPQFHIGAPIAWSFR